MGGTSRLGGKKSVRFDEEARRTEARTPGQVWSVWTIFWLDAVPLLRGADSARVLLSLFFARRPTASIDGTALFNKGCSLWATLYDQFVLDEGLSFVVLWNQRGWIALHVHYIPSSNESPRPESF